MTREEGWYWVKNIEGARWHPVYFDGSEWLERNKDYPDEFYFKIDYVLLLHSLSGLKPNRSLVGGQFIHFKNFNYESI